MGRLTLILFAAFALSTLCACKTRTVRMDVLAVPMENTSKLYKYYEDWKTTEHFTQYKKELSGLGLPKNWFPKCLTLVPHTFKGFSGFLKNKKKAISLKGRIKILKKGSRFETLPQSKNSKIAINIKDISFQIGFQSGSELSITHNGKEIIMSISGDYGGTIGPLKTKNGDYVYVRFYY